MKLPKLVIAIDVDLTIVDTLTPWMEEFRIKTGEVVINKGREYNLIPEMNMLMNKAGIVDYDPMDFWRNPKLYDDLQPMPGSIDAIRGFMNKGYQSIFVSACVPEHIRSKTNFLKRFFPVDSPFIDTHDKHFIAYDRLIDDKMEHVRSGSKYRPNSRHTLFTGVRLDGLDKDRFGVEVCDNWNQINN